MHALGHVTVVTVSVPLTNGRSNSTPAPRSRSPAHTSARSRQPFPRPTAACIKSLFDTTVHVQVQTERLANMQQQALAMQQRESVAEALLADPVLAIRMTIGRVYPVALRSWDSVPMN